MTNNNMPGSFGSNKNRGHYYPSDNIPKRKPPRKNNNKNNFDLHSIIPERRIDIICVSLITVFLIVVICT